MTLAAYKRTVTVGSRWTAVEHWNDKMRGKTRTVTKVQTCGYWYVNDDSSLSRCYTPFQRASEMTWDGTNLDVSLVTGQRWKLRLAAEEVPA